MKIMKRDVIQAKQDIKFKETVKEHERDIRLIFKKNTVIAQLHQKTNIKIDFQLPPPKKQPVT